MKSTVIWTRRERGRAVKYSFLEGMEFVLFVTHYIPSAWHNMLTYLLNKLEVKHNRGETGNTLGKCDILFNNLGSWELKEKNLLTLGLFMGWSGMDSKAFLNVQLIAYMQMDNFLASLF